MSIKAKRHGDPFKTRTGRTRLGTLNFKQLNELMDKESRPKNKAKIQRRIQELARRPGHQSANDASTMESLDA